ncbi:hypothetical protein KCP69_09305 [Salmonella enterica subsp. enterica]|nr:hypothetical protein KCP69_09305 [Salmonella enterica subsp. enterica]
MKAKKDRVENYESMNIDYVVRSIMPPGALLENITWAFTAPAAPESGPKP